MKTLRFTTGPLAVLAWAGLLAAVLFLARSPFFEETGRLTDFALTADALLTLPLFWFLMIRKTKIPNTTVVLIAVLGGIALGSVLPESRREALEWAETWCLPFAELFILGLTFRKIRKIRREFAESGRHTSDFFDALKVMSRDMIPAPFTSLFVTEISLFYYGFWLWKTKKPAENEFSSHKNSGTTALFYALLFVIAIETAALHLLLMKNYPIAAFVLTGLSVYSGFQIFGFVRSLNKRFHRIAAGLLELRFGILGEAKIPTEKITGIEISSRSLDENDKNTLSLAPIGDLAEHNVILQFSEEITFSGFYGQKRKCRQIAFFVDEKDLFVEKCREIIEENKH